MFLVLSAKTNTFLDDWIDLMSFLSLFWKSFFTLLNCTFEIIFWRSFLPLQVQDTLFSAMVLLRTFINYVIDETVPFHWALCFFSAIVFWSLVTWLQCDVFIMSLNNFWHIIHATVADFTWIVVENFVKLVAITTSYHLNTRYIPIRQHFQVTCGTWKVFQVKHLT